MTSHNIKHALDFGSLVGAVSAFFQLWTPIISGIAAILSLAWVTYRWWEKLRGKA